LSKEAESRESGSLEEEKRTGEGLERIWRVPPRGSGDDIRKREALNRGQEDQRGTESRRRGSKRTESEVKSNGEVNSKEDGEKKWR
jgi:hypothetical protein